MEARLLLPDVSDPEAAEFYDGCRIGELRVQACDVCSRRWTPPKAMCASCHSMDLRWEAIDGRGVIWSYVVAHSPLLPAYEYHAPYPVITVALLDDPLLRFVGNLVSHVGAPIDSVDPAEIAIGQRVDVAFERVTETVTLPRWLWAGD